MAIVSIRVKLGLALDRLPKIHPNIYVCEAAQVYFEIYMRIRADDSCVHTVAMQEKS